MRRRFVILSLAVAAVVAVGACTNLSSGNTITTLPDSADYVDALRDALITAPEIEVVVSRPFTSIDTFELDRFDTCRGSPLDRVESAGRLAKAYAGRGSQIIAETLVVFNDEGLARRFIDDLDSSIIACESYGTGEGAYRATPAPVDDIGDLTRAYMISGADNTSEPFGGELIMIQIDDIVVVLSAANIGDDPISEDDIVALARAAAVKVETSA